MIDTRQGWGGGCADHDVIMGADYRDILWHLQTLRLADIDQIAAWKILGDIETDGQSPGVDPLLEFGGKRLPALCVGDVTIHPKLVIIATKVLPLKHGVIPLPLASRKRIAGEAEKTKMAKPAGQQVLGRQLERPCYSDRPNPYYQAQAPPSFWTSSFSSGSGHRGEQIGVLSSLS